MDFLTAFNSCYTCPSRLDLIPHTWPSNVYLGGVLHLEPSGGGMTSMSKKIFQKVVEVFIGFVLACILYYWIRCFRISKFGRDPACSCSMFEVLIKTGL
ncbi:hypothetical protein ABKN59_000254 [Abortiporus biennis]